MGTLIAHSLTNEPGWELVPASSKRQWMSDLYNGFPYRCLPLTMANQAGWVISCPTNFWADWSGDPHINGIRFGFEHTPNRFEGRITSHFGGGIITFAIPYLFMTEPGVGLLVRGLPNSMKFNCHPLEGFVETDWLPYTFTMNWKIQKPGIPVLFTEGDPICFIQTIKVSELEEVDPKIKPIEKDPELNAKLIAWRKSRDTFNVDPHRGNSWQKKYHGGPDAPPEGTMHKTSLQIKPFTPIDS